MPANFPSNPTANQTYLYNNIRWKYNGYSWEIDLQTGLIGATGATGAPGTGGGGGTGNVAINFDGGTPSSIYTAGPVFDCGGVN